MAQCNGALRDQIIAKLAPLYNFPGGFSHCERMADAILALLEPLVGAPTGEHLEPIIYALARDMARRGLFVRDAFGAPSILAIKELTRGIATAFHD